MPVKTTIQIRRDSASNWSSQVLAAGELALDTTAMRLKIGDGSTAWSSLGYLKAGSASILDTARTINGVSFDGSANITVTAAAGTLTGSSLNSGITGSSLTSVGTITSGTWSGSFGAVSGANLTSLTADNLSGTIPSAVLGNSRMYVGRTSIPLNQTSGNIPLSGLTQITFYGSTSGTVVLKPSAVSGTTTLTMPATSGTLALTTDGVVANDGTLTLAVSGTGLSGSASFTANQSGNSTFTVTSNATSSNTPSTIVARDASGNFAAGTINGTTVPSNKTLVVTTDINSTVQPYNADTTGIVSGTGYLYNTAGTWSYKNETYLTTSAASSTYLTSSTAASTYLTQSSASSTYLTSATASSTYLTSATASSTYLTQSSASNTYVPTSAIGSSVQAYNSSLGAIAALLSTGTGYLYNTAGTWSYKNETYLTTSAASSTYLTQSSASSTYLTQSSASSTYLTSATAASTYITPSAVASAYLTQANAATTYLTSSALTASPTISHLNLSAGTSGAGGAPLYLNSGTSLATPVNGALEYDGSKLYFTPSATTRKTVAYVEDTGYVTLASGSVGYSGGPSTNVALTTSLVSTGYRKLFVVFQGTNAGAGTFSIKLNSTTTGGYQYTYHNFGTTTTVVTGVSPTTTTAIPTFATQSTGTAYNVGNAGSIGTGETVTVEIDEPGSSGYWKNVKWSNGGGYGYGANTNITAPITALYYTAQTATPAFYWTIYGVK